MADYEFLDHTGEIAIKVKGRDLPSLFTNAAEAMNEYLAEGGRLTGKGAWEEVQISAPDLDSLLVAWLSEILYRLTTNRKIYSELKIKRFDEYMIIAQIFGQEVKGLFREIKAVTHHGLEIKNIDGQYEAVVTFDI